MPGHELRQARHTFRMVLLAALIHTQHTLHDRCLTQRTRVEVGCCFTMLEVTVHIRAFDQVRFLYVAL